MLTQQHLKKLLRYDPRTGLFTWLVDHGRWDRIKAGTIASDGNGRRSIRIDDKIYLASRLAVLYMTGRWPRGTVDHKDCNEENNCWSNLRPATHQEQQRNRSGYSKSGLKGVYLHPRGFTAYITIDKKQTYLGFRHTAEEAHQLYCDAAKQRYGEFARTD